MFTPRLSLLFPDVVSCEADDGEQEQTEVKDAARPEARNDSLVLHREAQERRNQCVNRQSDHGENERSRNGYRRYNIVRWVVAENYNERVSCLPARVYLVHTLVVPAQMKIRTCFRLD